MKQEVFINSTPQESRIAIVEDGLLAEFLIERKEEMGIAGNIYKGKVVRVLPGMQAAFIDIGMEKAGFLHASDFFAQPDEVQLMASSEEDVEFEEPPKSTHPRRLPLEKQISRGEELLVQVAKDPLGTKGARVTSHISLPGRYMVFMPGTRHIGISRRIENEEERKRLKEIAQGLGTADGGFILRTACEGRSKREIQRDLSFLARLWKRIQKKDSDGNRLVIYAFMENRKGFGLVGYWNVKEDAFAWVRRGDDKGKKRGATDEEWAAALKVFDQTAKTFNIMTQPQLAQMRGAAKTWGISSDGWCVKCADWGIHQTEKYTIEGARQKIEQAGGHVLSGMCFYQSYAREMAEANGWKRLATNSAKLVNILGGYGYVPLLATMEQCVEAAETGKLA